MSLNVNAGDGKDFEVLPPGLYIARCYRIIDIGTQTGSPVFGSKQQKKVSIGWEILDDPKMEDGRPFSVHKTYTASLNEKATLRADLEKWRNKIFTDKELENFDLTNILGSYCQLQVAQSEDGKYTNVQSIVMFKGVKPEPVNPDIAFDIDNPDMQIFESLSDNMKAKIMAAPEWKGNKAKAEPSKPVEKEDIVVEDLNPDEPMNLDDIPF